ncbi:MAG: hypothetical protein AMXMBFR13_28400 [Phycisphaerae bacterium]
MTTKSIGELPAFPMTNSHVDAIDEIGVRLEDGMTYKQWLVGKLVQGLSANPHVAVARVVDLAFGLADEIISRLDESDAQGY